MEVRVRIFSLQFTQESARKKERMKEITEVPTAEKICWHFTARILYIVYDYDYEKRTCIQKFEKYSKVKFR